MSQVQAAQSSGGRTVSERSQNMERSSQSRAPAFVPRLGKRAGSIDVSPTSALLLAQLDACAELVDEPSGCMAALAAAVQRVQNQNQQSDVLIRALASAIARSSAQSAADSSDYSDTIESLADMLMRRAQRSAPRAFTPRIGRR